MLQFTDQNGSHEERDKKQPRESNADQINDLLSEEVPYYQACNVTWFYTALIDLYYRE